MSVENKSRAVAVPSTLEWPMTPEISLAGREAAKAKNRLSYDPKPWLYIFIFGVWLGALLWFQPRLMALLDIADTTGGWLALLAFVLFIDFAWLYGIYNVSVVLFAFIHKKWGEKPESALTRATLLEFPPVAILYTTCNDFVEESVLSCVQQDYPNYTVYILDDSSDPAYKAQVDAFAARFPERVKVVRRPDRKAFKAGNLNHGLEHFAHEPYFAIADADEILPPDFLSKLVPVMEADPKCGFVQANHRSNPNTSSQLSKDLGIGIDLHWDWYQGLRNDYGFVMFLGHGALLRRECWEKIGGFPDIVSEDLGFAIHARELGYRGRFVQDVVCYEDFPETVRAFRIRHMKWTRGTSEFLRKKFRWLIQAKNITWTEKFDILFPTLNLPLTLLYFMFMVNANLVLPYFFGIPVPLTIELGGAELVVPIMALDPRFELIYTPDFFFITILTFFAPVLCFVVGLIGQPRRLFKFLTHSTALYAALGPLSAIGVVAYAISGKAIFLVTGDTQQAEHKKAQPRRKHWWDKLKGSWKNFIHKSHPDTLPVQGFEILTGLIFGFFALYMFQLSFLGLCLAFLLLPLMHYFGWENRWVRRLVWLPFLMILGGVALAGFSLIGMQTVFFGYGFHF